MPVQITTAMIATPLLVTEGLGNPLKWKVSAEEVIVYFSICTVFILFLVICLGTLFQWMVSQLIICVAKLLAWICCIAPVTSVYKVIQYKRGTSIKRKKNIAKANVEDV